MAEGYWQRLRDFIAAQEGFRPRVYSDLKGNATVGFGFNLNDRGVQKALRAHGFDPGALRSGKQALPKASAVKVLDSLLPVYAKVVDDRVATGAPVKLTDNQRIALTSMAYHGGPALIGPRLAGHVKAGNWAGAVAEIRENSDKDNVFARRRATEAAMFASGSQMAPLMPKAELPTFEEVLKRTTMLESPARQEVLARR